MHSFHIPRPTWDPNHNQKSMWWVGWVNRAGHDRHTPVGTTGFEDTLWLPKVQDLILKRQSNSGLNRFPQILSGSIFKSVWRRNSLANGYSFVLFSPHHCICNTLSLITARSDQLDVCLFVWGSRFTCQNDPFYLVRGHKVSDWSLVLHPVP